MGTSPYRLLGAGIPNAGSPPAQLLLLAHTPLTSASVTAE